MGYYLRSIKCVGAIYALLILSVHMTSAGLMKQIREAAEPKDMDYKLPVESETTLAPQEDESVSSAPVKAEEKMSTIGPEESSLLATLQNSLAKLSSSIQERADVAANNFNIKPICKPGDIQCTAGGGGQSQMQNELSKAVIRSFGTMMSEMVNSTISRSLVDFMASHGPKHGETPTEEHRAMVQMAAGAMQTVSSRVIKSFTFFIQMAISGAMKDLLSQLMGGVTAAYQQHQRNLSDMRAAAVLRNPPEKIPKPSELQPVTPVQEFDPIKTLLNAGALTSLSYPGFDLMSTLKDNLFKGDTNTLTKKSGSPYQAAPVLTPFGVLNKKK